MATKNERLTIELAVDGEGDGFRGTLLRFGDVADRGSYKETVENANVKIRDKATLNRQHDSSLIVAKAGTPHLELSQDASGVYAHLKSFPDTATAQEAKAQMKAGILTDLSMEYRVHDAEWDGDMRRIRDIEIIDLAMVARPAFPESRIEVASELFRDERQWTPEDEGKTLDPRVWL